ECDVVVDAPIIVSGRFESWHESADIPASGFFTTIIARLQLEAVYKGAASAIVQVVDVASLSKSPPGWYGASGGCGNFDEDPAGRFVILGLEPYGPDSALMRSNRLWLLYIGDAPEGEWYERTMVRLAPLGEPSPPATGDGSPGPGPSPTARAGLVLLGMSALLSVVVAARAKLRQ
ncbi:MAG TPA: hypothetical protein PJ994_01535, partial [Tepidiformaceae bacterium]|nr:hypothetical protein [Tepidiformaceae bacterium]